MRKKGNRRCGKDDLKYKRRKSYRNKRTIKWINLVMSFHYVVVSRWGGKERRGYVELCVEIDTWINTSWKRWDSNTLLALRYRVTHLGSSLLNSLCVSVSHKGPALSFLIKLTSVYVLFIVLLRHLFLWFVFFFPLRELRLSKGIQMFYAEQTGKFSFIDLTTKVFKVLLRRFFYSTRKCRKETWSIREIKTVNKATKF